jgi:hypothetical protein
MMIEQGMFEPEDLAAMRAVYEDLVSQPWFSKNPHAKEDFARYLIGAFPGGTFRPELDRPIVEAAARAQFARADDV